MYWGQIQSQLFSLWALAAIFEFLKESNCVPDDQVFHQLVTSMTEAINSQAWASLSSASFLKQKRREALVSHLPSQIHKSVKLALLSTPSSSSLFSEDIIKESLTQVKEDFADQACFCGIFPLREGVSSLPQLFPPRVVGEVRPLPLLRLDPLRRVVGVVSGLFPLPLLVNLGFLLTQAIFALILLKNHLFGSRSHVPCLSKWTAVCPSSGPSGGTRVWIPGWWKC